MEDYKSYIAAMQMSAWHAQQSAYVQAAAQNLMASYQRKRAEEENNKRLQEALQAIARQREEEQAKQREDMRKREEEQAKHREDMKKLFKLLSNKSKKKE